MNLGQLNGRYLERLNRSAAKQYNFELTTRPLAKDFYL